MILHDKDFNISLENNDFNFFIFEALTLKE